MVNKIEFDEVRLAKCQFCGGEAVMIRTSDGTFFVECDGECHYRGTRRWTTDGYEDCRNSATPLEAARLWNRDYYHARGQYEPGGVGSEAWEKKEVDA